MAKKQIRKATVADVNKIYDLVLSLAPLYLEQPDDSLPEWFSQTLTTEAFSSRITSEEYDNYVYVNASDKTELNGYISLKKPNHLYHLFVAPNHHKKGIARELWQYVLTEHPCENYLLRSSLYAVPIYKKFGFVEEGEISNKDNISFQAMKFSHKNK